MWSIRITQPRSNGVLKRPHQLVAALPLDTAHGVWRKQTASDERRVKIALRQVTAQKAHVLSVRAEQKVPSSSRSSGPIPSA